MIQEEKRLPGRNLGLELARVTEAAAIAAARYMGMGSQEKGDKAAAEAMRAFLRTVDLNGIVVIGEGTQEEAPTLFNGEYVGNGEGPELDVAVGPVEGAALLAFRDDRGEAPRVTLARILPDGSLDEGLAHIQAPVLLLPAASDLLLMPNMAREVRDGLMDREAPVDYLELEGTLGHVDGIASVGQAGDAIRAFLEE